MERRSWAVFFDTNVLVAALVSTKGAAHEALRLVQAGFVRWVVSRQVVVEARRVLDVKTPEAAVAFGALLRDLSPRLVEDPSPSDVQRAARVIHRNDAPILAAAVQARVDYLITWNTKHFLKKRVKDYAPLKIATPDRFLNDFRKSVLALS